MHIQHLVIRSYKSFISPTTIPLSPTFNVFIGPNNCGKTNILDAIQYLVQPSIDPERLHHHRTDLSLTIYLTPDEQRSWQLPTSTVTFTGGAKAVQVMNADHTVLVPHQYSHITSRVKILAYDDFENQMQIERDYSALAQNHPTIFQRLQELVREYFPEVNAIDSIADATSDRFGSVTIGQHSITIDRLGGGFKRVLVILLYALHPDYAVVLIDEPEIHLHPGLIKKVLKVLHSTRTNQILVTSHSPLFITARTLHQVYRVLKDEQGSHVYSIPQSGLQIDHYRLEQELNADNLEMFYADKVLLVEGVSDRILMRGLIDRFYHGPDDVKVIYTNGKTNIDIYSQLMQIFHIPFLVMLDHDALTTIRGQLHSKGRVTNDQVNQYLQDKHIIVLKNGTIEDYYPRHYQRGESKPLNALHAVASISEEEFNAPPMRDIKDIIEQL